MKLSELKNKRPQLYSFDESFSAIEKAIANARDRLKVIEPPSEVLWTYNYYPYNYSNTWDQACYVMRYLYAYAYEYFIAFSSILEKINSNSDLHVMSLGCGVMPDAWALQEASKRMELRGMIEYTGVDVFKWPDEYVPETTERVRKRFIKSKAGDYLLSCTDIEHDIIIFPKSLGDMYKNDRSDLYNVKKALGEIPLKDEFYMVFSFIDNEQDNRKDQIEMDYLLDCIRNRGYSGIPKKNKEVNVGICNSYPPFPRLSDELVEDSISLAKKHFMTSRIHENYYICRFTKVK